MTTSRRRIGALVSAALTLGLVAGCSTADEPQTTATADQTSDAEPGGLSGNLTIGTIHEVATTTVVDAFKLEHPGVTIDVATYGSSNDFRQVVGAQLAGGNAPDIIETAGGGGNVLSAMVAGSNGFYTDMNDRDWAGEVPSAAAEQFTLPDGQMVGVPIVFSSIAGIYNQGAVNELGLTVPETWSEVLQFCTDAAAADRVAYGLGLSDTWTTQLIPYALTATLVYGQQRDFIDKQLDGTATFSDSAWKQALEQYMEMEEAGCFNASPVGTPHSQVEDGIREGSILATVSVASTTAAIATGGPSDLELTYAAFPATDDPEETHLGTSASGFAMNADSANEEVALAFMDFLATPQAQVDFALAFGDAAVMPGDHIQESQTAIIVDQFVDGDRITTWPDRLWPSTTVQPAMFDGVQALFNQQATVEEVLQDMDAAFADR